VASSPEDIVSIWKHHCRFGSGAALVVANPVPKKDQIPFSEINGIVSSAVSEASSLGVVGPELTPFLLKVLNEKTDGRCLKTNVSLAVNNIRLGAALSRLI